MPPAWIRLEVCDAPPGRGRRYHQQVRELIKTHERHGDQDRTRYEIESGRSRPLHGLMDVVAGMLKANPEFIPMGDQKLVYETVLEQSRSLLVGVRFIQALTQYGCGFAESYGTWSAHI